MADPFFHRYVRLHSELIQQQPDTIDGALNRFSELHKRSEHWASWLLLAALIFGLLTVVQLLGVNVSAEVYGQKLSDLPEKAFFTASLTGLLYLFSLINILSAFTHDALIKWITKERYKDQYDLMYRSWLSESIFGEITTVLKIVPLEKEEWFSAISVKACWILFVTLSLVLVLFPPATLIYFCIEVSSSSTSLAEFEFWFTSTLAFLDIALLFVGVTNLLTLTGEG